MNVARILLLGAKNWTNKDIVRDELIAASLGISMDRPLQLVCLNDTGVSALGRDVWSTWVGRFMSLYLAVEKYDTPDDGDRQDTVRNMVGDGVELCVAILDEDSSDDAIFGVQLCRDAGIPVRELEPA